MSDYKMGGGQGGGGKSSSSIPGAGATSGFNESCLGNGKGGRMGATEGAGTQYPDIKK